jgi:glycosyltransferase involved in cell wall biosynthesis
MKILFYNHTGTVSGAEHVLLMILSRLDRDRFDPVVVCPDQGLLQKRAQELGARVETVAALDARFTWRGDHLARYLKSFYQTVRQLRRKIIDVGPDLIHANSIRSGLVATAATIGLDIGVVWHLHDLLPRHPISILIRWVALLSSRTRMIAVSQVVADNFCGAFASLRSRLTVVLNAVDLDKFHPIVNAGKEKRAELQLSESAFVIGIVGQLTPRKGQLELLRAFAQTRIAIPRAVLLLVGAPLFNRDHEYAEELKQTARELGVADSVHLLGARGDVAAIMQALDLLVVNSSAEPFCLVGLEGMACGTPVLVADTGGLAAIIEHDKDGWLVPPGDEEALAAQLVRISRQPKLRTDVGSEGLKKVVSGFGATRYLTELQTYYLRCLQTGTAIGGSSAGQVEASKFA